MPTIVHLQWEGPYTWEGKGKLHKPSDYGIYAIYGCHVLYGVDTLLYIGKASKQTFAVRLSQEVGWMWERDFQRMTIYVGRLHGWDGTPSVAAWEDQIDRVEKLLILAYMPAYNAQKSIDYDDPRLQEFHILNWGCHRNLLPEVSGWRHSSKYDDETGYKAFTTDKS